MQLPKTTTVLILLAACSRPAGPLIGGGRTTPPPPPPRLTFVRPAGVVSAVAGDRSVLLRWRRPAKGFSVAVFRAATEAGVHASAPVAEDVAGESLLLGGLDNHVEQFFAIGVRADTSKGAWRVSGVAVRARPAPPVFVDAAAAAGGDGRTPAKAFNTLQPALDVVRAAGGGNVWLRAGDYVTATLQLPPGACLYGGFAPGFAVEERKDTESATILTGPDAASHLLVDGVTAASIIDGVKLVGRAKTAVAIDVIDTPVDLRSVRVEGYADRGIRLRNSSTFVRLPVRLAACSSTLNGADGVSGAGAFDVRIDGCNFDRNVQEGIEFDDLVALDGSTAFLHVTGSRFFGNGAEGIDTDLGAPLIPGPRGGHFDVEVRGCSFDRNASDGMLIDIDYELAPGWDAGIVVRGCSARANRLAGFHVDVDAAATVALDRLLATANATDGIWISSEADPGVVVVSASVAAANGGAGMRASVGKRSIACSHCTFAGNRGGALVSESVPSSAASCIVYRQPTGFIGTSVAGSVTSDVPTFRVAPEAYGTVTGMDRGGFVVEGLTLAAGSRVELADDAQPRNVARTEASLVFVEPRPTAFEVPGSVTVFAAAAGVREDYHLRPDSPAAGKGLAIPGGEAVDAGSWGAPLAGPAGVADPVARPLLVVTSTEPPVAAGLGNLEPLRVRFSGILEASSIARRVRAVLSSGAVLPVGVAVAGAELRIDPPAGGWGTATVFFELHAGIRSATAEHSAPLVLSFQPHGV